MRDTERGDWFIRDVFDRDPPTYAPTRSELAAIMRATVLRYGETYALQCNGYEATLSRGGKQRTILFDAFDGISGTDQSIEAIRKGVREFLCAKAGELWDGTEALLCR